ncbi:hypothetical protein ATANTOWER_010105 [Ataeniobius toweri]|uniref:Uncharacterized protein n=1 Tax=Ataeniobius toweri TaxID=208326 RepID=A0ABU7CAN2_9TELE|nr:hypothetical protein [Ataeniobius toweri]
MRFEIHLVCGVLVVFSGSTQTGGQSYALPTAFTSAPFPTPTKTPAPPEVTEPPMNEFPQWRQYPAGRNETSRNLTATAQTEKTHEAETSADAGHLHVSSSTKATSQCTNAPTVTTPSFPATADTLSSTPTIVSSTPQPATAHRDLQASETLSTFSSRTVHTEQETGSTSPTSILQPQSAVTTHTTVPSQTSASGWAPVGSTHQEFPSELNIGDDDLKGSHHRSNSPLDPLLAGLLSVFIVTTAVVFTVLLFKFRQRVNHPEFHRLHDLPMDDLMEDTPLSRYAH